MVTKKVLKLRREGSKAKDHEQHQHLRGEKEKTKPEKQIGKENIRKQRTLGRFCVIETEFQKVGVIKQNKIKKII